MAHPQKHKQQTIDFFDKMQEKMQAEDSKRRKLNSKSSSSQPELMFLQFQSNSKESFTSKINSMLQQTLSKKTWKPPTINKSESTISDCSKKDSNNGICTSSLAAIINNGTSKINNSKEVNDCSAEIDTNNLLLKTDIRDNTASVERDKPETSNYYYFVPDKKLDSRVTKSIGTVEYESTHTRSSNKNGDIDLNNLVVECSKETMVLSQCLSNFEHSISDHGQEDLPTQRNLNLSKELDITISDHGTPTQQNYNDSKESDISNSDVSIDNNDRKFFGDQQREISDNEDIQLINSIDLILSENQESQLSQGESNIHTDKKKTLVKQNNSILSEKQGSQLSENESNSQTDVKMTHIKHKHKNGSLVESPSDTNKHSELFCNKVESDCKAGIEQSKLNVDTDSSLKVLKSSSVSCNKSVEETHVTMESNNHSAVLKYNEYNEIKVNPTEIKCQAIMEIENSDVFRLQEGSEDHDDNMKRDDTQECNQPLIVNQIITEEKDKEGVNVFVSGCIKNDFDTGPDKKVTERMINEASKNDKLDRKKENLKMLETIEQGKIWDGGEDFKEDNNSFDVQTKDRSSFDMTNEGKAVMTKLKGESDFCLEEISGFDDDGSCLMFNNSQLMELEQKYYENPDNLKQQIVQITQTPKTVLPQKTDVGVQTEYGNDFISLNSNFAVLPQIPPATAQWTKKAQETEKQLRDSIKEVGRLNAILMKIRKDLWPQRNSMTETKF